MRKKTLTLIMLTAVLGLMCLVTISAFANSKAGQIVHDSEYYILKAQNDDEWAADDKAVDKKLAEFREKNNGKPPNVSYSKLLEVYPKNDRTNAPIHQ